MGAFVFWWIERHLKGKTKYIDVFLNHRFCFACTVVVTQWQSGFSTELLLQDQRTEICSIASLSPIQTNICNLSSFNSSGTRLTEFLEGQKKNILKSQHQSLVFVDSRRFVYALCRLQFAVQAILVDVEGYKQADGSGSCKLQDQLSGRLSEVGSWQPNGYILCCFRNSSQCYRIAHERITESLHQRHYKTVKIKIPNGCVRLMITKKLFWKWCFL